MWGEVGMGAKADRDWSEGGLTPIPLQEGLQIFGRIAAGMNGQVGGGPGKGSKEGAGLGEGAKLKLFEKMLPAEPMPGEEGLARFARRHARETA